MFGMKALAKLKDDVADLLYSVGYIERTVDDLNQRVSDAIDRADTEKSRVRAATYAAAGHLERLRDVVHRLDPQDIRKIMDGRAMRLSEDDFAHDLAALSEVVRLSEFANMVADRSKACAVAVDLLSHRSTLDGEGIADLADELGAELEARVRLKDRRDNLVSFVVASTPPDEWEGRITEIYLQGGFQHEDDLAYMHNLAGGLPKLARMDQNSILEFLRLIDRDDLYPALYLANETVREAILSAMNRRVQEMFREDLADLGPSTAEDTDRGLRRTALIVRELDEAGKLAYDFEEKISKDLLQEFEDMLEADQQAEEASSADSVSNKDEGK